MAEDKGGRPEITEEQKKEMVQKLEPYLKSGLSIRKALIEAEIPRSTFYDLMEKDQWFSDQINRFRQFVSIMLNSTVVALLQDIVQKKNKGEKLTKDDLDLLKWYATTSTQTRDEYGERREIGLFDPEAEIQRVKKELEQMSKDKGGEDNVSNQ
jgi:hypothetical protein